MCTQNTVDHTFVYLAVSEHYHTAMYRRLVTRFEWWNDTSDLRFQTAAKVPYSTYYTYRTFKKHHKNCTPEGATFQLSTSEAPPSQYQWRPMYILYTSNDVVYCNDHLRIEKWGRNDLQSYNYKHRWLKMGVYAYYINVCIIGRIR